MIERRATDSLGRPVVWGADHRSRWGELFAAYSCREVAGGAAVGQAEVQDLDPAILREHDVGRPIQIHDRR